MRTDLSEWCIDVLVGQCSMRVLPRHFGREHEDRKYLTRPLIKPSLQAQAMILIYIHDFALIISAAGLFAGIKRHFDRLEKRRRK